ncbi:MAG: dTDP-glucose 4,6-dehydratase [Pelagibacteraceae bacterium TMED216]|nr:MAG: dTDP-glucose 4,6-dehydratase [Pelagibacteraceae bacterium TMED216]|tara:strand:+ start:5571 stop:6593 length:1023 start_codon:yes stop_codon:yes gene_type:complete
MKKIVVTGGYGFIGSNLVRLLLKKKYRVLNIDKISYSSNKYNLLDIKDKKYKFKKLDICNHLSLYKTLKNFKPDVIFNLAADTHVDRSIESPNNFIKNNYLGVFSILECIRKYEISKKIKLKLVHISTDEVYGDIKNKKKSVESDAYKPSSPYSATKGAADLLIKSYVKTFGINAIISNCSNNYGPRQFPEKLIPKIIYNILNNKDILLYAKGKNSREWIYVDDHCEALIALSKKGKNGQNYNIGSGNNMTNINLTRLIIKIFKEKFLVNRLVKIKFVKDRPGHDFKYSLNLSKIKKTIKFKNRPIGKGLIDTINWYLSNEKYFDKIPTKSFNKRLGLLK